MVFHSLYWLYLLFRRWQDPKAWDAPEVLGSIQVNSNVASHVPIEVASFAALDRARYKWGQVALGPCIPCCNDSGELTEYLFLIERNSDTFSQYSDIKQSIRHGQFILRHGESQLNEKDRKVLKEKTNLAKVPRGVGGDTNLVVLPYSLPDERIQVRHYGQQLSIGADRFGAVIVSARYNAPAILGVLHYLPAFIVNLEQLHAEAAKHLGNKS
jgi:hypothetical protein